MVVGHDELSPEQTARLQRLQKPFQLDRLSRLASSAASTTRRAFPVDIGRDDTVWLA
jgi:hypothetical protein